MKQQKVIQGGSSALKLDNDYSEGIAVQKTPAQDGFPGPVDKGKVKPTREPIQDSEDDFGGFDEIIQGDSK